MNFKNLVLDRELIKQSIFEYDENMTVEILEETDTKHKYSIFNDGIPKALIIFYLNNNGRTTIQTTSGKNPELSQKVAQHVVEQCHITIASKGNFSIKPLTQDSFELLLEYLQDECQATIQNKKPITSGQQYSIHGKQGDKVTLSYYNNSTLNIQGCPLMLHSQIVEFLGEILDLKSLVEAQLKLIKTNINVQETLEDLEAYLPNSYKFIGDTIKAILSPCIALRKLEISLADYSVYTFPALRGLEGYIKKLFKEKDIIIDRQGFKPFLREDNHNSLNEVTRNRINCVQTCTAINRCYSYYKNNRHGLFHVDGIIANSRLIKDRQEAEQIVEDVLELIETTYLLLPG